MLAEADSRLKGKIIERREANEADLRKISDLLKSDLTYQKQLNVLLKQDVSKYKNKARNNFWYGLSIGASFITGAFLLAK